jgi:exopolyphosphatase/guanosine-5'-triphosphate,3'-diphosphate pyrophosphatase
VRAIGTSGTLENIALLCGADHESTGNGDARPTVIERAAFDKVLKQLLESDAKHRAQMSKLDAGRADQIVAGAMLLDEIFRRLKLRRIQMCKSALREGLLVDILPH